MSAGSQTGPRLGTLRRDRSNDGALRGKDVAHRTLVVLGPDVGLIRRIDQPRINAQVVRRGLNTSEQHVADAKVAGGLVQIAIGRVASRRIAVDDRQTGLRCEIGGQRIADPIGDVRFRPKSAEGKHGKRAILR